MTIIDHNKYSPKTGAAKLGKSGNRQKAVFSVVFVIFLAYAICLLYPFFFCFNASLMDGGRTFMRNQIAFPNPIKLGNYTKAFSELEVNDTDFFGMLLNSVWFSFGTAFLPIFFASMTSYVVCKYRFPGRNFLYSLVIVTMMIPIYGSLPAQYRLFDNLGMVDSPLILLYYCSGFGTNFLVIYSFFKGISWSYAEAAFLDGANEFQVFFKIMFPMAMPAVSAIFIIAFTGGWNDYLTPILYMSRSFPTLASGIYLYEKKISYASNHPVYFAGVIISLIPILVLFGAFQNTIMSNVYAGGLKG